MSRAYFAGRPARGSVECPGGKSHAIRAAWLAAQARGESELARVPEADDVARALAWVEAGGARVERRGGVVTIVGLGSAPAIAGTFDAGDSAAVLRMGLFWLASGRGRARVTGSSQLVGRPHGEGLRWLARLGARIEGSSLPIEIEAHGLAGGRLEAPAAPTSQFVSGCLLAAPSFAADLTLALQPDPPSRDYLDATLAALADFGVAHRLRKDGAQEVVEVARGAPRAARLALRPDASHTLLFATIPAILGGAVKLRGASGVLGRGLRALERAGARIHATSDGLAVEGRLSAPLSLAARPDPDLVPPLAIAALFASGESRFEDVGVLRAKESDRLAALADAIVALGGMARLETVRAGGSQEERVDLCVSPAAPPRAASLDPRGDHRLAMAFGLAALAIEGVRLRDENCVSKSMPDYWERLREAVG